MPMHMISKQLLNSIGPDEENLWHRDVYERLIQPTIRLFIEQDFEHVQGLERAQALRQYMDNWHAAQDDTQITAYLHGFEQFMEMHLSEDVIEALNILDRERSAETAFQLLILFEIRLIIQEITASVPETPNNCTLRQELLTWAATHTDVSLYQKIKYRLTHLLPSTHWIVETLPTYFSKYIDRVSQLARGLVVPSLAQEMKTFFLIPLLAWMGSVRYLQHQLMYLPNHYIFTPLVRGIQQEIDEENIADIFALRAIKAVTFGINLVVFAFIASLPVFTQFLSLALLASAVIFGVTALIVNPVSRLISWGAQLFGMNPPLPAAAPDLGIAKETLHLVNSALHPTQSVNNTLAMEFFALDIWFAIEELPSPIGFFCQPIAGAIVYALALAPTNFAMNDDSDDDNDLDNDDDSDLDNDDDSDLDENLDNMNVLPPPIVNGIDRQAMIRNLMRLRNDLNQTAATEGQDVAEAIRNMNVVQFVNGLGSAADVPQPLQPYMQRREHQLKFGN